MNIKTTIGFVALTMAAVMTVGYIKVKEDSAQIEKKIEEVDVSKSECPALIQRIEAAQSISKIGRCSVVRTVGHESVAVWLAAADSIFDDSQKRQVWLVEATIASSDILSIPSSSLLLADQKSAEEGKWLSIHRFGGDWLENAERKKKRFISNHDAMTPTLAEIGKINNARILGQKANKDGLYKILNESYSVVTLTKGNMTIEVQPKQASR